MRLSWSFRSCVKNFSMHLRGDAFDFFVRNLNNPAILELLVEARKANRCVLQLDKNYSSIFQGGKKWKMMRELFCLAFGRPKNRRKKKNTLKKKKFPGVEASAGPGPSLILHLSGMGVALTTVTSVGVVSQLDKKKRKNHKRQRKRHVNDPQVEPLYGFDD